MAGREYNPALQLYQLSAGDLWISVWIDQSSPVVSSTKRIQVQALDYSLLEFRHFVKTADNRGPSVAHSSRSSSTLGVICHTVLIYQVLDIRPDKCVDYLRDGHAQLVCVHVKLRAKFTLCTRFDRPIPALLKLQASVFGRDGVIRTLDPHNPIVVRYQAAPRPVQAQKHNAMDNGSG